MRLRSVLPLLAVGAGVAAVIGYAAVARSADHLDSPSVLSSPSADIADVFSWIDNGSGTSKVVLAMTTYPNAPTGAKFDTNLQYVFHTTSGASFGGIGSPVDVIATFDDTQKIQLWVGTSEYVTGDASSTNGLMSADGMVKVYAGLRADPFFFNLDGFHNAQATVESTIGVSFNDAGCPALSGGTQTTLQNNLSQGLDGGAANNNFATFNELAIVVLLDKSLVTSGGMTMSVWGATYAVGSTGDAGTGDAGDAADAGGE